MFDGAFVRNAERAALFFALVVFACGVLVGAGSLWLLQHVRIGVTISRSVGGS